MPTVIAFIVGFKSNEYLFLYLNIEYVCFPQVGSASNIGIVNIM